MAIVGVPIDNGDGSYSFQQDTGEPLILRGEAAKQAYQSAQGAPPPATPPSLDPSIVDAAARPPDQRTAELNAFGEDAQPGNEFEAIRQQGMSPPVSAGDVRSSTAKGIDKVLFGTSPTQQETPRDIGNIDEDQPQPGAGARGGGPGGKGVFFQPPQESQDPAAGLRYVKGGRTPHTWNETGQKPMSDANEAATKQADQGVWNAAKGSSDVRIEKAKEEAGVRAQMAIDSQLEEARVQQAETERRSSVEKRLAKLDQMSADAAAEKVDPEHYWGDKSASFKFESALFAGLGSFAEGLGGGKNYAMKSLEDAIDRDMKAQDKNLQNKRDSIAQETNLLGQLRTEYKDREGAAAAFKAAKYGTALAKLDEIGARKLPEAEAAKLEEMRAELIQKRQEERNKAGQVLYAQTDVNAPGGLVGGADKKAEQGAKEYGTALEGSKVNEAEASLASIEAVLHANVGKTNIPGIAPENVLTRGLKSSANFLGGAGSGEKLMYNPEERANRQVLANVKAQTMNAISGAAVSEKEREILTDAIQSASTYGDLANTVKMARQKIAAHKASLQAGFDPKAVSLYDQRKRAAQPAPSRARVKPAGEE